jgi:hypothetical protein
MRKLPIVPVLSLSLLATVFATNAWAGVNGWDHVGNGGAAGTASLNGNVTALHADGTDMYVGGAFTDAGGVTSADHIARWNGTSWSALGPLNGAVHAITLAGGKVFAGGVFTNAGGNDNADFLAVWDGSSWAPFCTPTAPGPSFNGNVNALQVIGNTLFVGGAFQNGAGIGSADYLLACDLTTGASSSTVVTDGDFTGAVSALTADSGGTLYAGGQFINVAGNPAIDHIGSYDGTWHAMGTGSSPGGGSIDSFVRALASDGTNVFVGSDSSSIGGVLGADHVAKWNGSAWSAMGSGYFSTLTTIYALAVDGPIVFAGGNFQNANGDPMADQIAYWDGSAWDHLGSNGLGGGPYIGDTTALATLGARVFAGGGFTSAGGDTLARGIAQSPIHQPDAKIATSSTGPSTGDGVYSATASKESASVSVQRGKHGTLYLTFENDGLKTDTYTLHATGSARGYATTYSVGAANITSQIRSGTYSTGSLSPGVGITVKLVVDVANSAGNSASFLIRATENQVPADAVKAIVKAK